MTIRNLDALFEPKAIALIGASNQPGSVGDVLARNLFGAGFHGPIMPVNPHEQAIHSTLNYPSVADLPIDPDLAVIATPGRAVPGLIAELGGRGCRAAIVITAGFGEGEHTEGQRLRQEMLNAAQPHLLRVVGPNCLGFISPHVGINASFAQLTPPAGDLAFITQSGAVATAVLDWAAHRGIGFSHLVSLGDMSDVDFGDLLDYLALDRRTRAILLYVESITHARKFMSAARIAARSKPVVVVKAGRSAAGAKAALSHTGALAGADAVYDAAFRRVGVLRVYRLRELFEAVATLAAGLRVSGDRLAILTNGGGIGVLATDAVDEYGGELAMLAPETLAKLDTVLPPTWSHGNPVDILGDAGGKRYADALAALLADRGSDAILVLNCPTAVADSMDAARAVVGAAGKARCPVLTSWLGEGSAAESRRLLSANRLPTYETPDEAVRAFMHLARYRQTQDLLMQTPPAAAIAPDRDSARGVIANALREGRAVLTEPEAKAVLKAYGIPVLETVVATDPQDAARRAAAIGFPVALKILSPDITHKSDVGGVRLHVASPEAVERAARDMQTVITAKAPQARLDGFIVQAMAARPQAHELIAGIAEDPAFGPVILFGQGGTGVEVIGDRAIGLPPLNMLLARDMIGRTRIARLLAGYRDRPAADLDAIALTLVKLSQLLAELDEVVELDINPLLADADGVLALDARVVVRAYDGVPGRRMAIRPYPSELAHDVALSDGTAVHIRPIRPEDEPVLLDMLARSAADDIRLRFFAPLKEITHTFAARLTQIDYDREMALIATSPGDGAMLGVARLIADPNGIAAEFAVFVRSDLKGRGLGYRLMTEILDYARRHGIKRVHGDVLRENTTMLSMAAELGFGVARSPDPMVVRVEIDVSRTERA